MKVGIPKGTRDFSPKEIANRNYIFSTIEHSFENFGFQPIETPSFENSSTLMGKYGEEGDRLIFKILNSGDYFKDIRRNVVKAGKFLTFYNTFFDLLVGGTKSDERIFEIFYNNFDKAIKTAPSLNDLEKNILKNFYIDNKIQIKEFYNEIKESDELNKLEKLLVFKEKLRKDIYSNYVDKIEILDSKKSTSLISEKALRYDLTVPFARYVVQHQNEITFPFKRYQIQPVWRADRPQKGRFREFFQCDADVVGSKSLVQEVEFIQLYDTVFTKLGLNGTTIKMNNRKILSGIAEVIGASDKLIDFTVALDKLDKIGKEGVVKEMLAKGITEEAIEKVNPLFSFTGSNLDKLASLENMLSTSEEGLQGVNDLHFVINAIEELGLESASLEIDVTLARGLNYYTGAIFEVAAPKGVQMGSIGGGGRYDDLTQVFGIKEPLSGVGISFGLDRIYLVMEELGLFKEVALAKPKVLFLNFNSANNLLKMKAIKTLRDNNVKSELYPDVATSNKQQKKQFKYATNREIEFVVTEVKDNKFVVKNNGERFEWSLEKLLEKTRR